MSRALVLLALTLTACGAPPPHAAPTTPPPPAAVAQAPTPSPQAPPASATPAPPAVPAPARWHAEHRLIDLHEHIDPEHIATAVRVMDRAGIGVAVNLSGGYVTHAKGEESAFAATKRVADASFPGRFVEYMNLDYTDWDAPDFPARAARQVEEGHRLGAAGLKEFKRLGLGLRDKRGKLIAIDDPKLDPAWKKAGELGMPVSIHVADPKAFWAPYDPSNERWTELRDHRGWWFGDRTKYPPREELLAALERVITRHPETTFVCVHFGNNAEDLDWVDAQLDKHPNMLVDIAARVPEIGRHDPKKVHDLFVKHQDRILFATDFQVGDRLILGSGGSGPSPTEDDAVLFFEKHWRWLETWDAHFPHMTPIQGDWTISGIGLPDGVLQKIYFGNARRLLAQALPPDPHEAAAAPALERIAGARARELVAAGARLVDVRSPAEYAEKHIAGAENVPVDTVAQRDMGPKDRPMVVYCAAGKRAARATAELRARGYTHVYLLGPMSGWDQ